MRRAKKTGQNRPFKKYKIKISKPQPWLVKLTRLVLALIGIVLITTIFGIFLLFFQIRQFVNDNINSLGTRKVSGIYSQPFMIFKGQTFSKSALLKQIEKRGYAQIENTPKTVGEFSMNDSVLHIVTRDFLQPNGLVRTSGEILYNFTTGEIQNFTNPAKNELILEPTLIASLDNSDDRVSSYIALENFPSHLPKAFLAIEDIRFYEHWGIDLYSIARALFTNLKAGKVVQGASTITQQLAKNLFFSPERTIIRKIKEALAAICLEQFLSKDKILELYLNEVYFGRDGPVSVHGVAEASRSYLNKTVDQLTLAESALLAGLVKAPSNYALRKNFNKAKIRQEVVLEAMQEAGFITEKDKLSAQTEVIKISKVIKHKKLAPHFITQVQKELQNIIDINSTASSGLSVFTGIDRQYQRCAENAVFTQLEKLEKTYPSLKRKDFPLEAGLVSIEPHSGLIKAWVGGRDYSQNQFNHVSQAERQIGSTIKPFVYLTALSAELNNYKVATPISILADEPMTISIKGSKDWQPENYDRKFRGDVTLRYALENSLNIPAVYVSQKVGIDKVANVIESFNISKQVERVPSLALGATESTLLRLTSAYAGLANGGIYVEPRLFSSVLTKDKKTALAFDIKEKRVAEESAVFILTNILQGVIERGTARVVRTLGFNGQAAGKTGTTNDARDAWFIGYTPYLSTGVWVGFDDNKKIGLTGGKAAAPIWADYMKCIAEYTDDLDFLPPAEVTKIEIDTDTNQAVNQQCFSGKSFYEYFVKGTEPQPTNCNDDGDHQSDDGDWYQENQGKSLAEQFENESRSLRNFWENIFR